jgi:hypothetical protein
VEDIRSLGPIKRFNRGVDLAELGIHRAAIDEEYSKIQNTLEDAKGGV